MSESLQVVVVVQVERPEKWDGGKQNAYIRILAGDKASPVLHLTDCFYYESGNPYALYGDAVAEFLQWPPVGPRESRQWSDAASIVVAHVTSGALVDVD